MVSDFFLKILKMSLYLEYKIKTNQNNVTTSISYHRQLGLLAILSYTQNDEAQILICDELVSITA
jgi:hypothetical protein